MALPGFFQTAVRVTVSNPDGIMSFSTEDFMAPPVALRIRSRIPKKAKSSPDHPLCLAWRPWLSLLQAAGFTPPLSCAPWGLRACSACCRLLQPADLSLSPLRRQGTLLTASLDTVCFPFRAFLQFETKDSTVGDLRSTHPPQP